MRLHGRVVAALAGPLAIAVGLVILFMLGPSSGGAITGSGHASHEGRTRAVSVLAPALAMTAPSAAATTCGMLPHGPSEINDVPSCLAAQFPSDYAGVYQTSENAMTIVEVHRTSTLEAAATAGLTPYEVQFTAATYSYTQLQQVRNAITAARSTLQARGIEILCLGINTKTNQVTIGITKAETTAADGRYLVKRFGEGMITVYAMIVEQAEPARR